MRLVIIPTYNEHDTIAPAIAGVLAAGAHVLVVDDASPDGTGEVVRQIAARHHESVFLLEREEKAGLGSAYRTGFSWGLARGYDVLCEMDADGSHDPADLLRLFAAIDTGADLAIGSRRVAGGRIEGWGMGRHLTSWGAMTVARVALHLKTRDVTAGFRAYRATLLQRIPLDEVQSNGYAFQEETLLLCEEAGARIVELPVVFRDRVIGVSKLGIDDAADFFVTLARLWRTHRAATFLSYAGVGILGTITDVGLLVLFVEVFGFSLIPANALSFLAAVLQNYLLNRHITFAHHAPSLPFATSFLKFFLTAVAGLLLSSMILAIAVSFGVWYFAAKILAVVATFLWNYLINVRWTFSSR